MNTDKLLEILLEAIDYSFLQTNGDYDKSLTYPVIDKVRYIKEKLKNKEAKEADLNDEISKFIETYYSKAKLGHKLSIRRTAAYFYRLGLKAQKGE